MRIAESQRRILHQMFISTEENKELLQKALASALCNTDIAGMMQKEATQAVSEVVHAYFAYGEGREVIKEAVHYALANTIPKLFKENT